MAYNPYLGPPVPIDPPQTDPAEPGTIEPIKPPVARPNPAISRAQRLRDFLSANPGRRGPQMGRNPDGSIAYDPSVYGAPPETERPFVRPSAAPVGRPFVGPRHDAEMPAPVVKPGPSMIAGGEGDIKPPYMPPKPGPNAPQGPFDKSRLLAALGPRRLGGP